MKKGEKVGRLTLKSYVSGKGWLCLCSCGSRKTNVSNYDLKKGRIKSCGCIRKERGLSTIKSSRKNKSIKSGDVFDKLTLLNYVKGKGWDCFCSCGKKKRELYQML